MLKPDLLWVPVSGRRARLAGRGPPEVSGERWRSEHVAWMSKKPGMPKKPGLPKLSGLPENPELPKRSERPGRPGLPQQPERPKPELPRQSGSPEKTGESPDSGRHFATWFISSWRSDGAFRDETLPRVKVGAGAARMTETLRDGQEPRRATSPRWRARRGRRRGYGEADPSPHLQARLRPDRAGDHAPPD
jgi:hypothetical protein